MEDDLPVDTAMEYRLQVSEGDIIDILAFSDDFAPIVLIFDEQGTLLLANEGLDDAETEAGFEQLEIPQDLTLVLWVASLDDEVGGSFTFSVLDAGE